MGDRYWLPKIDCVYCKKVNTHKATGDDGDSLDGVYYAPSSGFFEFNCEHCGKMNFIRSDDSVVGMKIEDLTEEDIALIILEFSVQHPVVVMWKKIKKNRRK